MSINQHIDSFVQALYNIGLKQWVISPGSRNAPVIASIVKSNLFNLISAPDERSAAFIALGANQSGIFTAALCTSGTAALNYYPAVAESFYSQVPLLLVTADRPPELIDNWDGQCIRQSHVFSKHCNHSFHFQTNFHHPSCILEIESISNQVNLAYHTSDSGPIHINIPLHEPIYQNVEHGYSPLPIKIDPIDIKTEPIANKIVPTSLSEKNILVIAGELNQKEATIFNCAGIQSLIPILAEKHSKLTIKNLELWEIAIEQITQLPKPDVIITIGKNIINKKLKNFIKKLHPIHYHIHTNTFVGNPFQTKIKKVKINHNNDFTNFIKQFKPSASYLDQIINTVKNAPQLLTKQLATDKELEAIQSLLNLQYSFIHLGNSSIVRKAGLVASHALIYANRGTSGIDGSIATAIGFALSNPKNKIACIVGDVGFLYETNAMWVSPYPTNLQIYVINNGGGGIFKSISGPMDITSGIEFITTPHHKALENIAQLHHLPISYTIPQQPITGGVSILSFNPEFVSGSS